MKKLLILIVAIAVFLHFYPQPEIESWLNEQKSDMMAKFSDATDTQIRLKADKIYSDLKSQFEHFSNEEQDFLKEVTSSRESVKTFFTDFCEGNKQSPHLHSENQKKVCNKIEQFSALL
jgi:hypothetical protein